MRFFLCVKSMTPASAQEGLLCLLWRFGAGSCSEGEALLRAFFRLRRAGMSFSSCEILSLVRRGCDFFDEKAPAIALNMVGSSNDCGMRGVRSENCAGLLDRNFLALCVKANWRGSRNRRCVKQHVLMAKRGVGAHDSSLSIIIFFAAAPRAYLLSSLLI